MNDLVKVESTDLIAVKGLDLKTFQNTFAELPDVETDEGYIFIQSGIKEGKKYKRDLLEKHKELKAPILKDGRVIDDEKNRIEQILISVIEPMVLVKKEFDNRKEKEKAELEDRLQKEIIAVNSTVMQAVNMASEGIKKLLEDVRNVNWEEDFHHLKDEAGNACMNAIESLDKMLTTALEAEKSAAKIKELEDAAEVQRQKEADEKTIRDAEKLEDDHELALAKNILFDNDRAIAAKENKELMHADAILDNDLFDEKEKERIEREKEIAANATKEAEALAAQKIVDAEAKAAKAALDAEEAAKQAVIDKAAAVKKAADEATAEAVREAKIKDDKIKADAETKRITDEKRAKNKAHQTKVLGIVKLSFMKLDLDEATAKKIAIAIAKNEVDLVSIKF